LSDYLGDFLAKYKINNMKLGDLFVFRKDIAAYIRLLIREDQTIILGVTYTNGPRNFKSEGPYIEGIDEDHELTIIVNSFWHLILEHAEEDYLHRIFKLIWQGKEVV